MLFRSERDRILNAIVIAEEQRRAKAASDVAAMQAEQIRTQAAQAASLLELDHQRAVEQQKQDAEHERSRKQAELALEMRAREAEAREHDNALDAAHQRRLAEIEELLAKTRASRELVTVALPEIARALQGRYGNVTYTQIGGDAAGGPLGAVPAAFAQLLALARSFGVELPKRDD